jgi:hypothetical protein
MGCFDITKVSTAGRKGFGGETCGRVLMGPNAHEAASSQVFKQMNCRFLSPPPGHSMAAA